MYPPAAVVVHSEWVCGTVCRRSPLPWRWWVGCICGWLTRSRRSTNSCISTVWLKTFTLLKFSYFFTTENFKQKFYTPFTCSYLYVQLPTFIKLSLTLTKLASSNFFYILLKMLKITYHCNGLTDRHKISMPMQSLSLKCMAVKNFSFKNPRDGPQPTSSKLKYCDISWWCRMGLSSQMAEVGHTVAEIWRFFAFFEWNVKSR